ncbi:MAG: nuclear transport factor 2 family protein [Bacteroidia bacterium]
MRQTLILLSLCLVLLSCAGPAERQHPDPAQNQAAMVTIMQKHLDAVSNQDLETLASTMSPHGNMQLILPGTEIIDKVEGFMGYHREWFATTGWTFETKIVNAKAGPEMGMAIAEVVYREAERDGKPYFNRMIVSYDLQKIEGHWYIVKDHASSVEKSSDTQ